MKLINRCDINSLFFLFHYKLKILFEYVLSRANETIVMINENWKFRFIELEKKCLNFVQTDIVQQ